jgi:uncharacterized protein
MLRSRTRAAARALGAALLALQPVATPALWARAQAHGKHVHPAMWKLSKGPSTIYLLGTIHALPPHFEWMTGDIRTVIGGADRLVLEAVIDQNANKTAEALLKVGIAAPGTPPLAERIDPKMRPELQKLVTKSGLPVETLDRLKTWAAAMMLFGTTVSSLGVSSADGVEEQLKAQFRAQNKPIEGLETLEEQLGFFDTLTEPQQRDFLASVVDQKGDDARDFAKMLAAWSKGDEKGIQVSFDKDMKADEVLRQVLIARRDSHWATAIVKRLSMPGTQLIAVGAGHLVGPDSVQAKLKALGYTATRVE